MWRNLHYITRKFSFTLIILAVIIGSACQKQNYWENDIQDFEQSDATNFPDSGAVLFTGSSSIRMWSSLEEDFPEFSVINRGFGGSEMSDLVYFAERIILPYKPRHIVIYSGDNDIAAGKTPECVLADFKKLIELIHAQLPETRITLISIKPSIARWEKVEQMRIANELLKQYIESHSLLSYVDIFTPSIGADGNPRQELFLEDGLHLNAAGYNMWTELVMPHLVTE